MQPLQKKWLFYSEFRTRGIIGKESKFYPISAPLRIHFNKLDLQFLKQIEGLKILGVFLKEEIEKEIGTPISENVKYDTIQSSNLLPKLTFDADSHCIKGFQEAHKKKNLYYTTQALVQLLFILKEK